GLYERWPDPQSLLSALTADQLEDLLPSLAAGMIPKMRACLAAVRCGVPSAHVLDGRTGHWVHALIGGAAAGTLITGHAEVTRHELAVLGWARRAGCGPGGSSPSW